MKLHWFAFDLNAYISNTMRLSTEAHGAYLLLMLDYYSTGQPCPDDDTQLAAVTKLPLDVWKSKYRKVLEPLFNVRDGLWHHERIASELLEAQRKHQRVLDRAAAGGHAKAVKDGRRPANQPKSASDVPKAPPQAPPDECLGTAQSTLNKESLSLRASARDGDLIGEGEGTPAAAPPRSPPSPPAAEPPEPDDPPAGIGTPMVEGWRPSLGMLQRCAVDGATEAEIEAEIVTFVFDKQASGAFSHDWNASFGKWWQRWKEHRAKLEAKKPKGKPRVEVNTTIDWDREIVRWKGNNSRWHRGLGPEPGQINCVCPPDLLRKHGIDPKTGLPLHEEADTTPNGAT